MNFEIILYTKENKGKLVAFKQNERVGYLTYAIEDKTIVHINNLKIKKGYEQKQIENELIDAIVELARNNRKQIIANNNFAKLLLEMNESYRDVLQPRDINRALA
ncbi:MAG: N-acetyltransferase [Bacilli bacterium]|nr:N-acetyltransferase [Bacilli bacterium]